MINWTTTDLVTLIAKKTDEVKGQIEELKKEIEKLKDIIKNKND